MHNISVSTWNIHGLFHKTLGDKTKNKDFINNINKLDFLFLTETWSNLNIDVPDYKAFVSDVSIPQTDKACRISGGIILLYKSQYENHVSIVKKSKNVLWCKISKNLLSTNTDLFLCGVYIPPEKSTYFEEEIFDELEADILSFSSKGNTMVLGDFNARTSKMRDFVSKEGNDFITDASENCFCPQDRENFDNNINNHGKKLINLCKNTDMRIINGRTKGDSLGQPTFHGQNGISTIDYTLCDQNTFQHIKHFIVKPPTYLSDHSQIISWFNIQTISNTEEQIHQEPPLHKLPLQFDWCDNSKTNFKKALRSPETQNKINEFLNKNFSYDINGVNECIIDFQNIFIDASKRSLKLKKKKKIYKITNVANKKWFDKECRFKRHELRKLANLKHKDPANLEIRNAYAANLKIYKRTLENKKKEFQQKQD